MFIRFQFPWAQTELFAQEAVFSVPLELHPLRISVRLACSMPETQIPVQEQTGR